MPGAERVPASCGASDALPRASPARPPAPWRPRKHPSSNCGPPLGLRAAARPAGGGLAGRSWRAGRRRKWIENNRGTQVDLRGALGARGAAGAWECFKDSPAAKAARGRVNSPPSTGMMPRSGQAGQMGACLLPASLPPPSREKAPKGRSRASSQGALWRRAGRGSARPRRHAAGKAFRPTRASASRREKPEGDGGGGGGALPAAELEVALWLPHGNEHLLELLVGDLRGDAPLRG